MIHSQVFKQLNRFVAAAASVLMICGLSGCGTPHMQTASDIVMDTIFTVTVYGDDVSPSELLDAGRELDENVLSRYAEGSLLNGYIKGREEGLTYELSGRVIDLGDYIKRCDEISDSSGGAFNVHIGALCDLWNIEGAVKEESEFKVPTQTQIEEGVADTRITDLGSVGKGIYLDLVKDMLDEKGVRGAVISAGGSVLVYGEKNDGSKFKVGIKGPFDESSADPYAVIELSGGYFVSTSGSYERYIDLDGVRYHHIIDPVTGYPAWAGETGIYPVSATIIACEGFISDALSTACFVMGPDKGIGYAESFGAEIIYIMNDGTYLTSDGIMTKDEGRTVFSLKV